MNLSGRAAVVRETAAAGGQRSGAWIVDHAIRALAAGCAERGRRLPDVGAVVLGTDAVSLRLTTPDLAPPPGWTAGHDGRTWQAALHRLDTTAVDPRAPWPLPLLVSLGDIGDGRLLFNLAAADGMIGLTGDGPLAARLVDDWSRRLTSGPWAGRAQVIRVGFDPDPGFTGLGVERLAQASPLLSRPEGGVVLFAAPPDQRDSHQSGLLLTAAARRWAVVAAGVNDATWRLRVDLNGLIDTGLFAEPVRLRW
ncbi:hypothetical protein GCM10010435_27200 [Winogradskya consettensis]|uniref:Uncharacterized protein n=1 Tax=Winogradskya consettensis TaxID=113560 RepID=A0A919VLU1_9ACTN|nr:hypothetical protein [Actinoplanes consettensis]GIM68246.1 hypothetical protein Aco04nite_09990 [Actinoplanes consettensis]